MHITRRNGNIRLKFEIVFFDFEIDFIDFEVDFIDFEIDFIDFESTFFVLNMKDAINSYLDTMNARDPFLRPFKTRAGLS